MKKSIAALFLCTWALLARAQPLPFQNPALPVEQRISDLLGRLRTDEKIGLMRYDAKGISRLGIPAYNWWNESLHGVGRAGRATVFPQAIGMAATFDESLIQRVASAIGDEARAKSNAARRAGNPGQQYMGLTFWTPNINIFRDPRWGRGHETYGEDPYLTARIGTAFVKGLQGDDPTYLKASACAKHFAVHSGPEPLRHHFDATSSETDLYNTYLPAFQSLVKEGVTGIMCAYNRLNTLPCCSSPFLLQDILRKSWGFQGYVVTDCWALDDIFVRHKFVGTAAEASALAVKAGVNVECGNSLQALPEALQKGLLQESDIDAAMRPNFRTLFRLGFFDEHVNHPYFNIPETVINSPEHQQLAYQTALQSMVLLSNKNSVLPLSRNLNKLFITGPNAADQLVLLANYNGHAAQLSTFLEGITSRISATTAIAYMPGCALTGDTTLENPSWNLQQSDAVVAVLGLSPLMEGENGDARLSEDEGDRLGLDLPANQLAYLRLLRQLTNKPIIALITGGSPMNLKEVAQLADAVLLTWYPGEQGGNAAADILFGNASPSGRLPLTFYHSIQDLPPYGDYNMKGRTYRYFNGEVLYPFGYGLSYTTFAYDSLRISPAAKKSFDVRFILRNTGKVKAEEVVQLYISHQNPGKNEPLKQLKKFERVPLLPGQSKEVTLHVSETDFQYWDENQHGPVIYPGYYAIQIGTSSSDIRLEKMIQFNPGPTKQP